MLSIEKADQFFSLKAFRAGRATEMIKQNISLGSVLRAGEWRSAAMLRYLAEDEIDSEVLGKEIYEYEDEWIKKEEGIKNNKLWVRGEFGLLVVRMLA